MKVIDAKNTNAQEIISQTISVLEAGGLVIFPTETTYGAGVDATNQEAVNKLLAYKTRREGKPLSIAIADKKMAEKYVEINDQADALIEQFLPGPVTVVCKSLGGAGRSDHAGRDLADGNFTDGYPVKNDLVDGVASEFGTVGIRIPDYALILDLVAKFQKPITATSANGSGKKRPYSLDDILKNLSEKQKSLIDLVIDAGELPHNEPSTVIDTTLSAPVTLRKRTDLVIGENESDKTVLVSDSETETKSIAGRLLLKDWNSVGENGLVFALSGSLGAGKTIFAKGVAEFLNIDENIKSPTHSYIEEYDFQRHQTKGKFFHLDMWKVENREMFERLEIASLIGANNVIVIEWFDQIAEFLEPLLKNVKIVKILIEENNGERKLEIEN